MHPDPHDLFEYRLACIEEYLTTPHVLGIYDVAAWLRQLLLDATPLIAVVNRRLHVPILFEVNTLPDQATDALKETRGVIYLGASLSPGITQFSTQTRKLSLDRFLKEPILITGWERVTVRELILWAAQEAGGVHFDPKQGGTSLVLNRLMRAFESEDRPVLGSTIIGLAKIVFDACQPLLSAIKTREA